MDYDFSTLNSYEFEKLVCDLLNRKFSSFMNQIWFQSFKDGKDKGIDLLASTPANDYEIVVQVKHYIKSSYSSLKSSIKNSERYKVDKIQPARYLFVTSQPLSYANKSEIMELFQPHIKSVDDIFGNDDLNGLLRAYDDIVEKHFKLWFSSTVALKKLFNYKYKGRRDEFLENVLKRKLRLFVPTLELDKAKNILEKSKYIVITGEPGVGKTTLSDILVYKYLSQDYEITIVFDHISEIEDVIRSDDSKQLFYFDDFLGHTQAEIEKSRAAETFLLKIISRVQNSNNKYLILNTRKFILSSMLERSERFRNFDPLRAESKIELSAYSYGIKRRMLDNHIVEAEEINKELIEVLKQLSHTICSHKNFSPRHIDFFTNKDRVNHYSKNELRIAIVKSLDNPQQIWSHAYCEQIESYERVFLNILYSLGGRASYSLLEKAFDARVSFDIKNNNVIPVHHLYKKCIHGLDGGFITTYRSNDKLLISFINPSLEDFLKNEISNLEIEFILSSAIKFEQWLTFYKPFMDDREKVDEGLLNVLTKRVDELLRDSSLDLTSYSISVFKMYFHTEDKIAVKNLIAKINDWSFLEHKQFPWDNLQVLENIVRDKELLEFFEALSDDYFKHIILSITDIDQLESYISVLQHFNFDFSTIFSLSFEVDDDKDLDKNVYYNHFERLLNNEVEYIRRKLTQSRDPNEYTDLLERFDYLFELVTMYFVPNLEIDMSSVAIRDWTEVANSNVTSDLIFGEPFSPENYDIQPEFIDYDPYESEYDFEQKPQIRNIFDPDDELQF